MNESDQFLETLSDWGSWNESLLLDSEAEGNFFWFTDELVKIMFTMFGTVSLVSLCIVFLVYWFIPNFQNIHGMIVRNNAISIALLTSFLLIVFNAKLYNNVFCRIIGYFGYYSSISMFSWMTIMCFDLSVSFYNESALPSRGSKRFVLYPLIGWGCGVLLGLLLLFLEQLLPPESDFHASVGSETCFISMSGNKFLYLFHLPVFVMMIVNIVCFFIIISRLIRAHRQGNQARDSLKLTQTQRYLLLTIL